MTTFFKYSITFCLLLATFVVNGQTIKALERAGDEAMSTSDYYAAISHYGDILTLKQDRLDIQYKYALAANAFNAFEIAEKSFKKVANTTIEDEDLNEELSNVKFWLGDTQKKLGKYDEAIVSFKDFIQKTNPNDPLNQKLMSIAAKQIEDCEWAETRMKKVDNHYSVTHLGDDINTPFTEFAPVIESDDLYFSTLRYENEDYKKNRLLSFSKVLKSNKGIIRTILLDSYDSTDKHVAHTAFTADQSRVFFTVCGYNNDREIECNLFSGQLLEEDKWGNIQPLSELINIEKSTTTQPNIGYEGDQAYLYYVSDQIGGKGGDDIWRAKLATDGTLGQPENLKSINTEGDDITPFFHSKTSTLYFSSDGRKNMGGYDVYSAEITSAGAKDIEHFGYPLNSSYNDAYFALSADENTGYISSNRPESKYLVDSLASCCYDLYRVDFENRLSLLASVFDKLSGEAILKSSAEIKELKFDESSTQNQDDNNTYDVDVLRNRIYELTFSAPGYESETISVSTEDLERNSDLEEEVKLNPLPISLLATALDAASMAALNEVTYTLSFEEDGVWQTVEALTIEDITAFNLTVDRNKKYRITATRDGYKDTFEEFDTYDMIGGTEKNVSLLLTKMTPSEVLKKGIDDFLPVPLYFDNDKPNGALNPSLTTLTYGETNDKYYTRKSKFLAINTANLSGENRTMAAGDMEFFFDNDVRVAKQSLNTFCSRMVEYLKLGNTAEIMIQGFASPLADAEYNLNLGRRRTSSIQNHMNNWNGGEILQFVNNGSLKITFKSYGESEARPGVSDNPTDIKNSVYSLDASKERRVEIIEVK